MSSTIQLRIGTHTFRVRVAEEDKPATLSAARKVESMLDEKRSKHKVVDNEHVALMVALELALGKGGVSEDGAGGDLDTILDEGLEILGES